MPFKVIKYLSVWKKNYPFWKILLKHEKDAERQQNIVKSSYLKCKGYILNSIKSKLASVCDVFLLVLDRLTDSHTSRPNFAHTKNKEFYILFLNLPVEDTNLDY